MLAHENLVDPCLDWNETDLVVKNLWVLAYQQLIAEKAHRGQFNYSQF